VLDLLVVSHVGGDHQRRAAGGFNILGGGVQADCAAGQERDLRAALGEETRRGSADAATSTGDDNDLSIHGLECRRDRGGPVGQIPAPRWRLARTPVRLNRTGVADLRADVHLGLAAD